MSRGTSARKSDLASAIEKLDKLQGTKRDPQGAAVTRKELAGDPLPKLVSRLCLTETVKPAEFNALVKDVWTIANRLSTLDKFNKE